mmetsp:Transcript_2357/g.4600  ORF Transcript_2357/g.4600 Transcript_2357/m.4600 type:complete len:1365 (+) Transcript_2357:414-4508(+)
MEHGGDSGAMLKCCTFHEFLQCRVPTRLAVLTVYHYSTKVQRKRQVLVLGGNMLALFPGKLSEVIRKSNPLNKNLSDHKHNCEALFQKTRSDIVFDLSEPGIEVKVLDCKDQVNGRNKSFEWELHVTRRNGDHRYRFQCSSQEQRDAWACAIRSFATRCPSVLTIQPKKTKNWQLAAMYSMLPGNKRMTRELSSSVFKAKFWPASPKKKKKPVKQVIVPDRTTESESQQVPVNESVVLRTLEKRLEPSEVLIHVGHDRVAARQEDMIEEFSQHFEDFYGKQNKDVAISLLEKAGWDIELAKRELQLSTTLCDTHDAEGGHKSTDTKLCYICFEDHDQLVGLGCGHKFCQSCWTGLIKSRIDDGRTCLRIFCMQPDCKQVIPPDFIKQHAGDSARVERFERLRANSFVETFDQIRWCPRPECGNVIEWKPCLDEISGHKTVKCDCGFEFCFNCANEAHHPATCAQATAWKDVVASSEAAKSVKAAPRQQQDLAQAKRWILKNSRPCPKCKAPIEKNEGCNHMVCGSCNHEFCWYCLGDWKKHGAETGGFYRCKMFQQREEELQKVISLAKGEQLQEVEKLQKLAIQERMDHIKQQLLYEKAQAHHKRVSYFLWRHEMYNDNGVWAEKILKVLQFCKLSLQSSIPKSTRGKRNLDAQNRFLSFLERVSKIVLRCRDVLRWSYVVSYFLNCPEIAGEWVFGDMPAPDTPKPIDTSAHGFLVVAQRDLEQITERLHNAVEAPALALNILNLGNTASGGRKKNTFWKRSQTTGHDFLTNLEFVNVMIPSETEITDLSCNAIERASRLVALVDDIHRYFKMITDPPVHLLYNSEHHQQQRMDIAEYVQVSTPDVSSIDQWLCSLCGWAKNKAGSSCLMCLSPMTTNIFTRYHSTLVKQLRKCVHCQADISDNSHIKQRCGTEQRSVSGKNELVTGSIEVICGDCKRNQFEWSKNPDELPMDGDIEDIPGLSTVNLTPGQFQRMCPDGHDMVHCVSSASECDSCVGKLDESNAFFCESCNWASCLVCAERCAKVLIRQNTTNNNFTRLDATPVQTRERDTVETNPEDTSQAIGWSCPECTLWNQPQSTRCVLCRTDHVREQNNIGVTVLHANGWGCLQCSFWNNREARQCIMCGSSNGESAAETILNLNETNTVTEFEQASRQILRRLGLVHDVSEQAAAADRPVESQATQEEDDICSPAPPFIVSCPAQCPPGCGSYIKLLKPTRRDSKRFVPIVLPPVGLTVLELWWETFSSNDLLFQSVEVTVNFSKLGIVCNAPTATVPDNGLCYVKIPGLENLAREFPQLGIHKVNQKLDQVDNKQPASEDSDLRFWIEISAYAPSANPTSPAKRLSVQTPRFSILEDKLNQEQLS